MTRNGYYFSPHRGLRLGRERVLARAHGRGECLPGVERLNARSAGAWVDECGSTGSR